MTNSILGNRGATTPQDTAGINPQMLQQLKAFKASYKGNPQQAVMDMLRRGVINNSQLQQAMQAARTIQNMIK